MHLPTPALLSWLLPSPPMVLSAQAVLTHTALSGLPPDPECPLMHLLYCRQQHRPLRLCAVAHCFSSAQVSCLSFHCAAGCAGGFNPQFFPGGKVCPLHCVPNQLQVATDVFDVLLSSQVASTRSSSPPLTQCRHCSAALSQPRPSCCTCWPSTSSQLVQHTLMVRDPIYLQCAC